MRRFSVKFILCLITLNILHGIVAIAFGQTPAKKESSYVKSDTLANSTTRDKIRSETAEEADYYRVNIKDNRNDNTFFSRLFLPGYKNKHFRALVLGYQQYFPKPFNEYYILVVEKAFHFPVIFFFLAIIIALIGNVAVVIGILLITNLVMNYQEKERKKLREFFEHVVTNMLLRVNTTDETVKILSQPYIDEQQDLLIDVLMDFQKSFRGDSDRQIIELYQQMDLGRISYNKTFGISFYKQVQGIRELANMYPYHATEMLASRLNDPNHIVRTEAQICYPHVNKEAPFEFLSILEKPFSYWAQLNVYFFIKIHELPVPSFERWINSPHADVVQFSIRMIDLFQQQENGHLILNTLNNSEEDTRYLAILACGNLHLFESKKYLKQRFEQENLRNQLEIIKAFQAIGEDEDFKFLEEILKSDTISLRLEACRTLYNLGDKGQRLLEESNLSMNLALSPYIAHVKDFRN